MVNIILYVFAFCIVLVIFLLVLRLAKRNKIETDKVGVIRDLLPGLNCKKCGEKDCLEFAKKLNKQPEMLDNCIYLSKNKYKNCKKVLEEDRKVMFNKVAFIKCKGGDNCENKYKYLGSQTCFEKNLKHSGDKICPFACLGCGDCKKACKYDAIIVSNRGYAFVDKNKCTGCGDCLNVCPNKLITMIPSNQYVGAVCNNLSNDGIVNKDCIVSCVHCDACASVCPSGAITMINGLPQIDASKCIKCGKCVYVCPNHVISRL